MSTKSAAAARTPRVRMEAPLRRRRAAIFAYMLIVGIVAASWVVRTPSIRDMLGASTAEMGLVIFGLSIGAMAGVLSSASLVRALGARATMTLGGASFVIGLIGVGAFSALSSSVGVGISLAFIGAGFGLGEIAINVEGAEIEIESKRSVLPALHGMFSLGTVVGAAAGIWLAAIAFPVEWHVFAVAVVAVVVFAWAIPQVPRDTGKVASDGTRGHSLRAQLAVWKDSRVVLLGLIVLALALAEGAANDWLPLLFVDDHGASEAIGSLVFMGFAIAMTIGRFSGGPLVNRFGKATVLRASTIVSATGILIVILADNIVLGGLAVLLWGVGAALGFPVTLSAAADSDDATATVGAVATAGYVAFLVGPPMLGFLGEHFGLRGAMIVVFLVVAAATFITGAAKPHRVAAASSSTPSVPGPDPA